MRLETAAIHQGQEPEPHTGAVIPPIYATSTFAQFAPGDTRGYDYTRSGNPNFTNLEQTLSALDRAKFATVFASGMAAISAIVSTLKTGSHVVAEENVYGCTYRLFDRVFEKFGVYVTYLDFANSANIAKIADLAPDLVWIESPTNPMLKVLDIAAISAVAKSANARLVVDNTFASPYFQSPLELGANVCVTSTTKYINGHSDCLGGLVTTNDPDWYEKMVFAQKAIGLNPSPFDTWLIQRGVKTLAVRMAQHATNALAFASHLEQDAQVNWVRYPFLASHPQHELAKRQMRGGSGIVTMEIDRDLTEIRECLGKFRYFALAESLGGVESLICHPASMTHASIPQSEREKVGITNGLIRFSVGIEAVEDLIADFVTAFQPY
ncbi:MAG TPA: cystathionine gamma-synthase [Lentisphaeria bacterium]|nr:cystathionine gamma-synthase [Lentisphaeria bacterium]